MRIKHTLKKFIINIAWQPLQVFNATDYVLLFDGPYVNQLTSILMSIW